MEKIRLFIFFALFCLWSDAIGKKRHGKTSSASSTQTTTTSTNPDERILQGWITTIKPSPTTIFIWVGTSIVGLIISGYIYASIIREDQQEELTP